MSENIQDMSVEFLKVSFQIQNPKANPTAKKYSKFTTSWHFKTPFCQENPNFATTEKSAQYKKETHMSQLEIPKDSVNL